MGDLPEIIAAFSFFGAVVICPLVYMIVRHQRNIAEIIHRNPTQETMMRVERLELELRELRAAHNELVLRADDARELIRRSS